jgi:hypothetical protein
MKMRQLSPEVVSLIHHVELNKSGWWKKAVGQVVKGVLWKSNTLVTTAELNAALSKELGFPFTEERLTRQLDTLIAQGSVTRMPGPNYKLSESARAELTASQKQAEIERNECREAFISACKTFCPELGPEKVWDEFSKALATAVQVTGANLFHLIADGNLEKEFDWLTKFFSKFESTPIEGLKAVVAAFFAPENQSCRNQVLRLLSAHFFAEASQLSPETLSIVEGERKQRAIKVVLDTNFIFSVLHLHQNPGDSAANTLIELAQRSGKYLDIRFYVLPSTLDEAQRVLVSQMHLVERIRTTQAMSNAALSQPLSSIAKSFFEAASKSPGLSASNFFLPYIEDLRTILLSKGIAVLEAHPSIYTQRTDVVDDVLDEMKREEREVTEGNRKSYEAVLHDAVIWHAVHDRRPANTDSPFEVEYWAVSIDWRLIAFDRRKRAQNASKLPVVLHPSNLVQLVQFWVPRGDELDNSLVNSFQLPMFFQSFDSEDEKATVKVLEAISRYENVSDIPEGTLRVVLANQVLRGRLKDSDASNDEIFKLVKDELIEQHKGVVESLEQTKGSLASTLSSLEGERTERERAEKELVDKQTAMNELSEKAGSAEKRAAEAEAARLAHEKRMAEELAQHKGQANSYKTDLIRLKYAVLFFLLPILIGLLAAYFGPDLFSTKGGAALVGGKRSLAVVGFGLLPLGFAFWLSQDYTQKRPELQSWFVAKIVNFIGKWAIAAPASLTFSAIYSGGIWDWVKDVTGWTP